MEFSEVVKHRWSPREYTDRPVPMEILLQVFEAARWAQSNWNEQPWRFLVATRKDEGSRSQIESYLWDGNARAKQAWLLGVAFAKKTVSADGSLNESADFDVGAACQIVALQAFELGVSMRFMGGFYADRAQQLCTDNFRPVVMFAMGYATEESLKRGPGSRKRLTVEEYLFHEAWNNPLISGVGSR